MGHIGGEFIPMLDIIIPILLAYLLGAIPFGLLIAKSRGITDIRALGSGNIGATNVWRVAGPKVAIWVYILDISKGIAAIMIARAFNQTFMDRDIFLVLCALSAVLGHIFPVYLAFRGGKGVNTALGVLFALVPAQALVALTVFIVIVALTHYISLGSLLGGICLVVTLLIQKFIFAMPIASVYIYLSIALALLIVYTHRENIVRLASGTESRFSLSSKYEKRNGHA